MTEHEANDIFTPKPMSWTGSRNINLLDPDPGDFIVSEIARSLSRRPRYGGFSEKLITVGVHTLLALALAKRDARPNPVRRAVTIHDWPEAYLSDIQRPLKATSAFVHYRQLERVYDWRMQNKWLPDLDDNERVKVQELVKHYDTVALAAEVRVCMPAVEAHWTSLPEPDPWAVKTLGDMLETYSQDTVALRLELVAHDLGITDEGYAL